MTGYIIRRVLWLIPILWAISLITFVLMHNVEGGPFEAGESKGSTAARQALIAKYNLDEPIYIQYLTYTANLLQGDFGPDLVHQGTSVNDIFASNWKPTVTLGILSTLYVLVVGIGLGILAAVRKNSILDYLSVGFATFGASTPNFVLGIILVSIFAVELKWFPAIGWSSGWTDWKPVILPVIVLGSLPAAYVARLTRASVLEAMDQDYVRTARAKGLREQVIVYRHIIKNAAIPVLTLLGPIIATLITGSFVVEFFFAIPGIGRSYVQAVLARDYPLIMATTLIYALVIALANLVVDIAYGVMDPRIKYS